MNMVMMHMWFYQGAECVFLFRPFLTTNHGEYFAGLVVTFILSVMIEFLSFAMLSIKVQSEKEGTINPIVGRILSVLLYGLQMLIALAVMLLVMTFNALICLMVVLGVVTGYAMFGFLRLDLQSQIKDSSFHAVAEKCCT
ncbi:unnamed protein product [Moneuplotes crassus]|uniref:Copper transport protein n=1 Tax=Euplotes crassus TaxID=5936 RepID=A0AAD1Y322_EUPCR|nr:unnamed protein product [Moneuplotes crassus]